MSAVCPMCHCRNADHAKSCDNCDYTFGQSIETLRELLHEQLTSSRLTFWVLFAVDVLLIGAIALAVRYGMVLLPLLPITFVTWQTYKAGQKVAMTKHSLQLTAQKPLPKATLRSG